MDNRACQARQNLGLTPMMESKYEGKSACFSYEVISQNSSILCLIHV